jgi:hypothetical protein
VQSEERRGKKKKEEERRRKKGHQAQERPSTTSLSLSLSHFLCSFACWYGNRFTIVIGRAKGKERRETEKN